MSVIRFLAVAALALTAACSGPITAPTGDVGDQVSRDLGEGLRPLQDGIYQLTVLTDPEGETMPFSTLMEREMEGGFTRPSILDFHLVRWHDRSASYAATFGNMRFYAFDGQFNVMEMRVQLDGDSDGSFFLPVEITNAGERLTAHVLTCNDVPQNYREARGWTTTECEASASSEVLRAMGLVDPATLGRFQFDRVADLPAQAR